MKLTREEKLVAIAGAILDVPRFVDIGVALHGGAMKSELWSVAHGVTSGAFSLVVALSIVVSMGALARAKRRGFAFYALAVSLGVMLISVGVAVYCALRGEMGPVFTAAAVIAPLLVVSNVPLAAMLRETAGAATETPLQIPTGANIVPVTARECSGEAKDAGQDKTAAANDDAQNALFRYTRAQRAFLDAVAVGADPYNTTAMADVLRTTPAAVRALRSKLRHMGALQTKQETP